tara:strand:+ start:63 stop:389 length:327 start_codon:yes stop_codon:yes gene_type:complete
MDILKEQIRRQKELMKLWKAQIQNHSSKNINEEEGEDDKPYNWEQLPGYNPEYFYDEDSLFAKDKKEMSKEDIVNELVGIYSYSQDGATDLVNTALETLITNLGGFKE